MLEKKQKRQATRDVRFALTYALPHTPCSTPPIPSQAVQRMLHWFSSTQWQGRGSNCGRRHFVLTLFFPYALTRRSTVTIHAWGHCDSGQNSYSCGDINSLRAVRVPSSTAKIPCTHARQCVAFQPGTRSQPAFTSSLR